MIRLTYIWFVVILFIGCGKEKQNSSYKEVNIFNENELEYSIDIRSNLNSISFLLYNKNSICVLIFNDRKVVDEFFIKSDTIIHQSFVKIVKRQLKQEIILNQKNHMEGYDVTFDVGISINRLSAKYPKILNCQEDISTDFDNLLVQLRHDDLVNKFFKVNIDEKY